MLARASYSVELLFLFIGFVCISLIVASASASIDSDMLVSASSAIDNDTLVVVGNSISAVLLKGFCLDSFIGSDDSIVLLLVLAYLPSSLLICALIQFI